MPEFKVGDKVKIIAMPNGCREYKWWENATGEITEKVDREGYFMVMVKGIDFSIQSSKMELITSNSTSHV